MDFSFGTESSDVEERLERIRSNVGQRYFPRNNNMAETSDMLLDYIHLQAKTGTQAMTITINIIIINLPCLDCCVV